MLTKKLFFIATLIASLQSFAQTIDYTLIPYRQGNKWGYADVNKNILIQPKYADAQWFSEGYAAVKVGNKWGYINKTGKLVIPARYTVAKSFRKGYLPNARKAGGDSVIFAGASTTADGYEKCINTKGGILIKCPAINENAVAENKIPLESIIRQKTYTLPNSTGLFDVVLDDYTINGNPETFYIAQKSGMYGVFNSKFETIVPFEYSSIKRITSNGNTYLQVQKNGMNGMLKANGEADIATDYSNLILVKSGNNMDYVIVKKDGKTYVKDITNGDIISSGYSDVTYDNNGGFVITDNNNLRGFYFMDKTMIAPKYSDVRLPTKGSSYLQVKTTTGKVGYISTTGNEYFVE